MSSGDGGEPTVTKTSSTTTTAAGGSVVIGNVDGDSGGSHDVDALLEPVIRCDDGTYKPLETTRPFSIHLLISVIISLVGIMLGALWPVEKRCDAYFIMLYLRAAYWFFSVYFDHLVKKLHEEHRLRGYHDFHKEMVVQRGLPLHLVSLWNTVILAIQAFIHHYYGENFWQHCVAGWYTPIVYITAFCVSESIVLTFTSCHYIDRVRRHNIAKYLPDAMRGQNATAGSVGEIPRGGHTQDLLERQADLIAYYKDHVSRLNRQFQELQLSRPAQLQQDDVAPLR